MLPGRMGPLHGIKVLDLSRILAGPWATQCLADYGATVWKIEKPGAGDDTRHWGPPWLRDRKGAESQEAAYFASANRGKQSLAIDFRKLAGQRLIRSLALRADVLIENFRVGTLARYGLGCESLQRLNARLIYCSISAFGQDGPASKEPGYDAMIQGMSGLMSVTGVPDSEPGAGPVKVGVAVSDLITGLYAVHAITAALYERELSGRGQFIDLALLDTQVAALANQSLNYLVTGKPPGRRGTAHPNIVPYQAFATKDGHLMLAVGNDRQFAAFCAAAGRPALATDKRYRKNAGRVQHRATLIPEVEKLCRRRTTKGWLKLLTMCGVPCGPINDLAQVFKEPQVLHRKLRFDLPHALGRKLPQVRNPVIFSRNSLEYRDPPPLLGQHTESVLAAELGLTPDEILSLKADATIA
jgi:crotonobetainyl-CoA:carnitine CoA-transferase CaiB-like acyl-CoA transferase